VFGTANHLRAFVFMFALMFAGFFGDSVHQPLHGGPMSD